MVISDFAIRRPIITIVTMIALVAFGIVSLLRLETDEFPDVNAPIVFVGIAYPGASPEQVEREVVDRAEDRLSSIAGLDELRSTATDGFAQIIVQFDFDKPVDRATQDVRDALSAIRGQLPQEILEPTVQRFDPNQQPIVSLALTSPTLGPAQLTQIADNVIAGDLRAIPGVAEATVVGADSLTLSVTLDPQAACRDGRGRGPGGLGVARAEPGRAGWPGDERDHRAHASGWRGGCRARKSSRTWWWPRAADRRSAWGRWRTPRSGPPSGAAPRCTTTARPSASTS